MKVKSLIEKIVKQNIIPIISPLGLGEKNQTYNINGDTAAGAIAKSLKSRRLLLMTNFSLSYYTQLSGLFPSD